MNRDVLCPSCPLSLCRNTETSTTARTRIQVLLVLVSGQESDSLFISLSQSVSVHFLHNKLEERILTASSEDPNH